MIQFNHASNPSPIPHPHQPLWPCPLWRGQGEVEAQGKPPHPGAGAAVDGAPGWGTELLVGHDALPAQDQACTIHGASAALDSAMGGRCGAAGKVQVKRFLAAQEIDYVESSICDGKDRKRNVYSK